MRNVHILIIACDRFATKRIYEVLHSLKRNIGVIRQPFEMNESTDGVTYSHNKHNMLDDYAVRVTTSSPYYATDYRDMGPCPGRYDHKILTSDNLAHYHIEYGGDIFVPHEDASGSLSDRPVENMFSTKKENVFYNADPFSYASSMPSNNKNRVHFERHKQNIAKSVPSVSTANRIDLIDMTRRVGRKVINAIDNGENDSAVISMSSQVSGAAVEAATHTSGFVGLMAAGKVASVIGGVPCMALSYTLGQLAQRMARASRLHNVRANHSDIDRELRQNLPLAKLDRNTYLNQIDGAISNFSRERLVTTWDKTDRLLPRYLNKLNSIGPGSDSVSKKFARSGASIVAHELKYSIMAETRILNEIIEEVSRR